MAQAKKPETQSDEAAAKGGYRVTVKRNGFRRAGRAWSGTTEIGADELTKAQLAALQADPMFRVEAA